MLAYVCLATRRFSGCQWRCFGCPRYQWESVRGQARGQRSSSWSLPASPAHGSQRHVRSLTRRLLITTVRRVTYFVLFLGFYIGSRIVSSPDSGRRHLTADPPRPLLSSLI